MVTFTCQHCNSCLKKNKIENHYKFQCRKSPHLTCIDCLKDFLGDAYVEHTACVSEAERYGGQDFTPKAVAVKQSAWITMCQQVLLNDDLTPQQRKLLQLCSGFSNVPRQRNKFLNFVKNVGKDMRNNRDLANSVFDLLETEFKKSKSETNGAGSKNNKKESLEQGDDTNKDEVESIKQPKRKRIESGTDSAGATQTTEETVGIKQKKKKKVGKDSNKVSKEEIKKVFADAINLDIERPFEINGGHTGSKKDKNKSDSDICTEDKDSNNSMEALPESQEQMITSDTGSERLSKKEKKKKKKESKYKAEIEAIENYNKEEEAKVEQEEATKSRKKKKKGSKADEMVEGNSKTGKETLVDMDEAGIDVRELTIDDPDESAEREKQKNSSEKFNWSQIIIALLQSTKDREMSLKKLSKKVCNEYQIRTGTSDTYEKVLVKFNKKVVKTFGVRVFKDRAKLMD